MSKTRQLYESEGLVRASRVADRLRQPGPHAGYRERAWQHYEDLSGRHFCLKSFGFYLEERISYIEVLNT